MVKNRNTIENNIWKQTQYTTWFLFVAFQFKTPNVTTREWTLVKDAWTITMWAVNALLTFIHTRNTNNFMYTKHNIWKSRKEKKNDGYCMKNCQSFTPMNLQKWKEKKMYQVLHRSQKKKKKKKKMKLKKSPIYRCKKKTLKKKYYITLKKSTWQSIRIKIKRRGKKSTSVTLTW